MRTENFSPLWLLCVSGSFLDGVGDILSVSGNLEGVGNPFADPAGLLLIPPTGR